MCLVMGEGCGPAQGGTVTVSREGDKTVLALDTGAGRYEERTDGDGALALAAAIAGACA